jgi:hypothetical protein
MASPSGKNWGLKGGVGARQRPTTCMRHFFHFFEKIFLKGEKKSHFSGI